MAGRGRILPPGASPFDRDIARLGIPALGALCAEPLYVLVDTAVVGHLGTPQLGGLAVAGSVLTTGFWIFNFLAYGTTAAVARHVGADDTRGAARQGAQAIWLALGLSLGLMAAGALGAEAAVSGFMGAEGEVRMHALTYFRVSLLGTPAVLLALVGAGYLRGVQDTRTTLVVAVGANVLNLVLELVLIYGLGFGVAGSAGATVFAQWCAGFVFLWVIARDIRRSDVPLRPDVARLRALVTTGSSLVVRTGALLACLLVATAVASRIGPAPLAAHQVAFQLWSFLALVLDAIAIAAQAMIGRLLGAGDADGARAAARRMLQWGLVAGAFFAAFVVVSRPVLVPLFSGDAAVRSVAFDLLLVVALLQPVNAIVFVLDGVLIGAGDVRYLAGAMLAAALLAFLPAVAFVRAAGLGVEWLWAALCVLMAARLLGLWARFRGQRWVVLGAPAA